MKKIFVLLLCSVLLFAACSGDTQTTTLNVYGMVCSICEGEVTDVLHEIGVEVLSISAINDSVRLRFDTTEITLQEIQNILQEYGYTFD